MSSKHRRRIQPPDLDLTPSEKEALWCMYSEAKGILKAISMCRSGVLSQGELKSSLREHVEFLAYCLDELHVPQMLVYDDMGDILRWVFHKRVIHGALKQVIDAHGPIESRWIGSASKRLKGLLLRRVNLYRKVADRVRKSEITINRPRMSDLVLDAEASARLQAMIDRPMDPEAPMKNLAMFQKRLRDRREVINRGTLTLDPNLSPRADDDV